MKKLFKKLALMVVALLTFSVGSNYTVKEVKAASGSTFDFSAQGYANAQVLSDVVYDENIKLTFDKAGGGTVPAYYNTGTAARIYAKGTLTVGANTGVNISAITKIVFTYGTGDGTNAITSNVGTFTTDTWTGSAESVVFTVGGTSKHRRFKTISVTYELGQSMSNEEIAESAVQNIRDLDVDTLNMKEKTYILPESTSQFTYNYSLSGDNSVFVLNDNKLTVSPVGDEKTAELTASVTCGDYTTDEVVKIFKARETAYSVSEANAEIATLGSKWVDRRVSGIITSITARGSSYDAYITDGEETLLVYGIDNYSDYSTLIFVGDEVVLFGSLGSYNGTNEIKYCDIESYVSNQGAKEKIERKETTASLGFDYSLTMNEIQVEATSETKTSKITFDSTEKRTQFTPELQVWVENEIVITNDKASSTNEVADYSNPARFYANSSLTISIDNEYAKITKIEIKTTESKYATAFATSIGALSSAEVTTSSTIATVLLLNEDNSLTFSLTGQVRASYIDVTYEVIKEGGIEKVVTDAVFDNISILFGATVETSLFETFASVKAGVMFSAGNELDTENAKKKEVETLVENDGVYSVGAVLEVFADGEFVTKDNIIDTKSKLIQEITAAVYFVVDGETLILEPKTYSVKTMVDHYVTNAASLGIEDQYTIDALKALQAYIAAE